MKNEINLFKHGSTWIGVDFHLHTKADKEFNYNGENGQFAMDYVSQLQKTGIHVGAVTNHNKFDKKEFKELKKEALKSDIWLVAGLEFSLKEGLHLLIAFEDSWYQGREDNISAFIQQAFYGISNFDSPPYPNSNLSLEDTVVALDQIGLDYFLMLPHPDADNGLFNVLSGRTLDAFIKQEAFNRVLALQNSRKVEHYGRISDLTGRSLAQVEGSDNAQAGIEAVGSGKDTFIKLGDFNFEALKYSLIDHERRICQTRGNIENSWIESISFEGGLLGGMELDFSAELNSLIGIRGSGKSSILEILRYALGITLGNQAMDRPYKNDLIEHVLKSGGKVVVDVVNKHNKKYRIEKIYGQKEDIYEGDTLLDVPSVDTVFGSPVYFGQKDLSNKDIDFEADLVKKLVGDRLDEIKHEISTKRSEIEHSISELERLENLGEIRKEIEAEIKDAQHKLKKFKEKGLEKKLKQQSEFESDIARMDEIVNDLLGYQNDLGSIIANHRSLFESADFESEINKEIFSEAESLFSQVGKEFEKLEEIKNSTDGYIARLRKVSEKLKGKKENLKEEFAKIKREIRISNLSPDDFLKLHRKIETSKLKLGEIAKSETQKAKFEKSLNRQITELNNLWHREFKIVENEVSRINRYESSLSIVVEYKGRKDLYRQKLKDVFTGTGLRGATYDSMANEYRDFIEIWRDCGSLETKLGITENLIHEFKKRFYENMAELITYRVEDSFTIKYHNKPLADYSLGQRATALILFLLAQKETDVLIIDQPEDDLDNQTIYEDVIKQIQALKGKMQFIFATHNANIPVLGDSEKIIACEYSESEIKIAAGSIDKPETQKAIVTIMEGGEEAFRRRKNIYELWSS